MKCDQQFCWDIWSEIDQRTFIAWYMCCCQCTRGNTNTVWESCERSYPDQVDNIRQGTRAEGVVEKLEALRIRCVLRFRQDDGDCRRPGETTLTRLRDITEMGYCAQLPLAQPSKAKSSKSSLGVP